MKLHPTLVDKIIKIYDVWGGRSNNDRLKGALANLEVVEYVQQDGRKTLVSKEEMENQLAILNQARNKVIR